MDKLMLIDGNSLLYRAFYALPPLTTSKGVHTNAVYGFVNMLFRIMKEEAPAYIVVAFDKKGPTFRHKDYVAYKATRPRTPDELIGQFDLLKEILDALHIKFIEAEGFEADDILGTLSYKAETAGLFSTIVTGDKDALQLVSESTHVLLTKRGITELEVYDPDKVMERYKIPPEAVPDLKGLMGDPSDNIPGVPGVGEKTASKLLQEYGNIDELLIHADELRGKMGENIRQNIEQIKISRYLATIVRDMDIDLDWEEIRCRESDYEALVKLFKDLEFYSLINRMESPKVKQGASQVAFREVDNAEVLESLAAKARDAGALALLLEAKQVDNVSFDLVGIGLALEGKSYYIPAELLSLDPKVKDRFRTLLSDPVVKIITHDGKHARNILRTWDIEFACDFDTMLCAYLLQPTKTRYDLKSLCLEYLGYEPGQSGARLAPALLALEPIMKQHLKQDNMEELYYQVELPLSQVLADMEREGFKVNPEKLKSLSEEFGLKLETLTQDIYEDAQGEFNINSPKQLGEILFEKLGLPVIKRNKTGYSTDVKVLEKLQGSHPIIDKIFEYRSLMKMKSTYADGLLALVDKETQKIHTSFNQTVTSTGRISSTEPNLQNIPVRTEIGRRIRGVFTASRPEHVLLSGDYSQIELRVLAHICGDEALINAFLSGADFHTITASEVFGVSPEEVTPLLRDRAKAVNFGIVYGISDYGLAQGLNISNQEAEEYKEMYFYKFPGVRDFMYNSVKSARELGYVTTLLNRRRYIPDITSRNFHLRSFAERVAMNTPIQGSAADIIKIAMVKVHENLIKGGFKSKLILQVHDELVFDVPKEELSAVIPVVKHHMETALELKVPLIVGFKQGYTWDEL